MLANPFQNLFCGFIQNAYLDSEMATIDRKRILMVLFCNTS